MQNVRSSYPDYEVHRRACPNPSWNFQIYEGELQSRLEVDVYIDIVVVCDYEESEELHFRISPQGFFEYIAPSALQDDDKSWFFSVSKSPPWVFTWRGDFKTEGAGFDWSVWRGAGAEAWQPD